MIASLGIAVIIVLGLAFTPDYFEISKNLDIFNSIYREVNLTYVDNTKPGQLMKTGIDAMLNSLDPYTNYYPENEIEDFKYMTTGEYGGIGSEVYDIDGKIIISDPYEGFAAFKAGLRAGDQIIGVDAVNVEGKRSDEITSLLKGQSGTIVKIKVIKAGQKTPAEMNVVREEIKTKAVKYFGMLPNSESGYIKLTTFTDRSSEQVKEAILKLKESHCKSLILDLRGNLGGLITEAINIVNFFIEKNQEVVFTKGRSAEWDKSYLTVNPPLETQMPLVVLVDEFSASASEIVSGALQDLDRAVIIGKRTYGKGLVQQTKDVMYNSKLKITVAKYYIPSGRCVQALDYTNRNEDGRVERVPDSLITAFKTKGGRIVYDGAGVTPDIKTKDTKHSPIAAGLISKYFVFNYATNYFLNHPTISKPDKYKFTDSDWNDFKLYLKDKDYHYKTRSEADLEDLKRNAEDEKYFDAIKTEYLQLLEKIKQNKNEDIEKNRDELTRLLEDEIVRRYYYETGLISFRLTNDNDVQEAIRLLAAPDKIKIILTTSEKPTKPFNVKKKF
ncbi:MAG: S41 family peptidase [Bacteroidetes bacterium]|nr:S41 family peptidase [Bacteroidota bacterium]